MHVWSKTVEPVVLLLLLSLSLFGLPGLGSLGLLSRPVLLLLDLLLVLQDSYLEVLLLCGTLAAGALLDVGGLADGIELGLLF